MKRNTIWRTPVTDFDYISCNNINLDGLLVPTNNDPSQLRKDGIATYEYISYMQYMPGCYGNKPVYSANKWLGLDPLPIVSEDWASFINNKREGEFMYSIYPTIYSITAATVVSCILTVIVFTNTQKPSIFLILGSLLSSINLINILSSSMKFLAANISLGKASGENLLNDIQSNVSFNVIDLFSVFILQLCQVQIIMRLFSRQKEKRFTFVMGVSLSIISQVIWAISTFHYMSNNADLDDDLSIMPAFIYLLRIAMNVMYSVLVCIYCFIKLEFIKRKNLILISIVSILSTNVQFAFFIADVANVWVAELSEVFNAAGYVVSTVIVWEWINRVHASEKMKQSKGILGRPFYEDELSTTNKVDRISLFIPEEDGLIDSDYDSYDGDAGSFDNENGGHGNGIKTEYYEFISASKSKTQEFIATTVPNFIRKTTVTLAYLTDQIIAYGLAVPRSVSVNSKDKKSPNKNFTSRRFGGEDANNDTESSEALSIYTNVERDSTYAQNYDADNNDSPQVSDANNGPTFVYSRAKFQIQGDDETTGGESNDDAFAYYDDEIEEHQEHDVSISDDSSEHSS
ncbi:Rim21 protein [Saccharomycopsis crataegensis]|uniref:pH-response regulator protein palH/RIM21 n=1 Tax=Saccharomycopsis crataegensis TaxID=43959 RepID=A0AAV5QHF8_9ASCO|nr:Rim21 protein [Saccharomycopsis crataegensis]